MPSIISLTSSIFVFLTAEYREKEEIPLFSKIIAKIGLNSCIISGSNNRRKTEEFCEKLN
ncbi:hypothetical protein Y697_14390 [Mesotoga sp. BH458_6_3_2_1]|nr:hypothetical protein Y697_14390 [Mesotoga sp. BH458_6_3_2_1]